ncbi:hypothetical protein AMJ87_13775 [candidate division WOR_3 bacterium SM23_60]|uniref:Inverse autotransporter beta-domain domain-containing protein n=1 Tax=candidate division WOR_3 bacterium SM23_60 TaxID=1703780 RepID=A0A0S8G2K0_UNCW3|nr:MAG: hypothetical protein AMJ87_13775 [candidate division WOR_3 bacterium SM23_60]
MINIVSFLICASAFSVNGIGEDMSAFSMPFDDIGTLTRIQFTFLPEFSAMREHGDVRSTFWTYRFRFYMAGPITQWLVFSAGNAERFNQSFDVYYEQDELDLHVEAQGGVEEVYAGAGLRFNDIRLAFRGSYLFGTAQELWNYSVGNYVIVDTFMYQYRGKVFTVGARYRFLSCAYEFLGDYTAENDVDTLIELPSRLSVGLHHQFLGGDFELTTEHSFWQDTYRSPTRFKLAYSRERIGVAYLYNPWYIDGVSEHGLDVSYALPIHRLGTITFELCSALRSRSSLQEVKISPRLVFTFDELFTSRQ